MARPRRPCTQALGPVAARVYVTLTRRWQPPGVLGRMIDVHFYRVRPGKVDQLKAWFAEATERADEVREAFGHEGVNREQAYLLETVNGHVLVAAVDSEDYETARRLFNESTLPIDVAQRKAMPEFTDGLLELDPIFDVQVSSGG